MKYKKVYEVLQQRKSSTDSFQYHDHSGWRRPNPTYIERIRPLWIIAEDPATERRFWIIHDHSTFKISIQRMTEQGHGIGPTINVLCASRTDLANQLKTQLFR